MVTRIHHENFDSGVRELSSFDPSTDRRRFTAEVTIEDATEHYACTDDNDTETYFDALGVYNYDQRHHDPIPLA